MSKFAQTYAPTSFDDLVFADDNVERLLRDYATGRRTKSIILHGSYGTGKSAVARMILKARTDDKFLPSQMINGANFKGSKFLASTLKSTGLLNLYGITDHIAIIDEVDLLAQADQSRLRATLDEYDGMFILTTNHLAAIDGSVQNRCDVIKMDLLPEQRFLPVAQRILQLNGIFWPDPKVAAWLAGSHGSWRSLLGSLEDLVQATKQSAA